MIILSFSLPVFAETAEMKWGGSGYETDNRFVARIDWNNELNVMIIVDSMETVNEIGSMQIVPLNKDKILSLECWKYEWHLAAPWACYFQRDRIEQLDGEGKIIIKDRSGQVLVEEDVDLNKLSEICRELLESEK